MSLAWYEIVMPRLQEWRTRRSAELRERRRVQALEAAKWRKEATRKCRNCLSAYRDQAPAGGRFMCTVCGHVSRRPVLDIPGQPLGQLRGSGKSWHAEWAEAVRWQQEAHQEEGEGMSRGNRREEGPQEKGERARRKAEEKRVARLEREQLEAEERRQREEVARLVEERRRARDEAELEAAERDHELEAAAAEREKEHRRERENEKRRQQRAGGGGKDRSERGGGAGGGGRGGAAAPEDVPSAKGGDADGNRKRERGSASAVHAESAGHAPPAVTSPVSSGSSSSSFPHAQALRLEKQQVSSTEAPPRSTFGKLRMSAKVAPLNVPSNAAAPPVVQPAPAPAPPPSQRASFWGKHTIVGPKRASAGRTAPPPPAATSSAAPAGGSPKGAGTTSGAPVTQSQSAWARPVPAWSANPWSRAWGQGAPTTATLPSCPAPLTPPPRPQSAPITGSPRDDWSVANGIARPPGPAGGGDTDVAGRAAPQSSALMYTLGQLHLFPDRAAYGVGFVPSGLAETPVSPLQQQQQQPPQPHRAWHRLFPPANPLAQPPGSLASPAAPPGAHDASSQPAPPPLPPAPGGSAAAQLAQAAPTRLQLLSPSKLETLSMQQPIPQPLPLSQPAPKTPTGASQGAPPKAELLIRSPLRPEGIISTLRPNAPPFRPQLRPGGGAGAGSYYGLPSGTTSASLPTSPRYTRASTPSPPRLSPSRLAGGAADLRGQSLSSSSESWWGSAAAPGKLPAAATADPSGGAKWEMWDSPQLDALKLPTAGVSWGAPAPAPPGKAEPHVPDAYNPMAHHGELARKKKSNPPQALNPDPSLLPASLSPPSSPSFPLPDSLFSPQAPHLSSYGFVTPGATGYDSRSRSQCYGYGHSHSLFSDQSAFLSAGSGGFGEHPVAAELLQSPPVPSDFVDCITREVMSDPVITADGHSYERSAIEHWLKVHDTSPMTGEVLPALPEGVGGAIDKTLRPNHILRSQIIEYNERLSREAKDGSSRDGATWAVSTGSGSSLWGSIPGSAKDGAHVGPLFTPGSESLWSYQVTSS
eukprot:jgi/Mesen1/4646/ME000241S03685